MKTDDLSLADLFRAEAEAQVAKLTEGLIALEEGITPDRLEELMRAAHSLKGAARIVGHEAAVGIAHELEESFVAAQEGRLALTRERVDGLLRTVDALAAAAAEPPPEDEQAGITSFIGSPPNAPAVVAPFRVAPSGVAGSGGDYSERLLTLAGEALVASRVLVEASRALGTAERVVESTAQRRRERATAVEIAGQRISDVVAQLYQGVLDARMRPFGDGVSGMPRMVRDTARELGRDVRFVVIGEATPVDRDVLRRIEAPLGHLLRNAVDHAIEPPSEREARGKPPRGTIRVEARHGGGHLLVSVEDDGRGIDLEAVRTRVVARGLADASSAGELSEQELTHFLFLPGFTLRDDVTAISGRGVGLDAVQTAVREIGGDVRVHRGAAGGSRFELQLPLTLSVVRALVVEIAGEAYAVPLARVHRVLNVAGCEIASVEGRQHFTLDDRQVGLVLARQLLGMPAAEMGDSAAVVVVGDQESALGIVVDRFVGEQELVLRGLDARLGKVQDVGGAALLADGSPALVLDVDDLQRTATIILSGSRPDPVRHVAGLRAALRKRVLVVDDSLTVRELERKMLEGRGYAVDVAVDGMDAWNAIRGGHFDLVVTDVDMPRMDGIELVTLIKGDATLKHIPVMIVSYKDRDEDRRRGLEAGADYYLTKGSFYDETMLRAIEDFIGAGGVR